MKHRIIEKGPFNIFGVMKRVHIQFEGENPEVAAMWKNLSRDTIKKLKSLSDVEPKGLIQASTNFDEGRMEEKGGLDHYIGVATTKSDVDEFTIFQVPDSTWAVFEIEDSSTEKIQNTWGRIFSEWFPESDYELAKGPEILWIEEMDNPSAEQRSEIWIPVRKSQ